MKTFWTLRDDVTRVMRRDDGRWCVWDQSNRFSVITAQILWGLRLRPAMLCWTNSGGVEIHIENLVAGLPDDVIVICELGPVLVGTLREQVRANQQGQ